MAKFGYVTMDCGMNSWNNDCTNEGRDELQNKLQNKEITKENILSVFKSTKFMSIGGDSKKQKVPALVEIKQFFPEKGLAKLGAYYSVRNGEKYGATINLKWDVPSNDVALLEKIEKLENRISVLEKMLVK